MSTKSVKLLSDVTVFGKYAKYIDKLNRRESWEEICYRNRDMHIRKYPKLEAEIINVYNNYVIPKKVLMSMRSAQFAGKPIEITPSRIYNCAFAPIDHWKIFGEAMFLLLGGTGFGYSVQKMHIEKLPEIRKPTKTRRYVVADSIEGWSDAVKMLCRSYFFGKPRPDFCFDDIRPKGSLLVTSGGKAPGPAPLKTCLQRIEAVFEKYENGQKLSSLDTHDIMCFVADAVLTGGIRRAALICLFDLDDEDMLTCKFGKWYETQPQRGRANNSAVILRHKITETKFKDLWEKIKESNSGEPGLYFTNNALLGTNPCCEISLKPNQFCNLTEVNISNITSQKDFNERVKAATFLGTLQAGYTNFHYLRDIWKKTTEAEALLGVSCTGICSGKYREISLKEGASVAMEENERVADLIGINKANRVTCVKPSGTTSLVLGTSSGIHAWFAPYYVRRMRVGKNEALYYYMKENMPQLVEDCFFKPSIEAVLSFPIKAPEGGIFRKESALQMLKRVKDFSLNWVNPGHRKGDNTHNVSATVSIKEKEWERVGNWMWKNRHVYNGLSVLPYDGGSYIQAPFEQITKYQYNKLSRYVKNVDFKDILESQDETDLSGEIACAGGKCEI